MNADTIIHEIREALDEPNDVKEYYTNDRLLSSVNSFYKELADIMEFNIRKTNYVDFAAATQNEVASEADNPIHKMPSDFIRLYGKGGIQWKVSSSDYRNLESATYEELQSANIFEGVNTSGTPRYYIMQQENADYLDDAHYLTGNIMMIYPYPDAIGNKLEAWYIGEPADLASTLTETSPAASATSPIFETRYHRILVWGVVVDKLLKRRRNDDATYYYTAKYEPLYANMFHYYDSRKSPGSVKRIRKAVKVISRRGENFP